MGGASERLVIVVDGRLHEIPASHPAGRARGQESKTWSSSLTTLGASLEVLGGIEYAGLGPETAICGFALFLVTAVLAGDGRYELATAVGVSAIIWTSVGVALVLGTVTPSVFALVALAVVGGVALFGGFASRPHGRRRSVPHPTSDR